MVATSSLFRHGKLTRTPTIPGCMSGRGGLAERHKAEHAGTGVHLTQPEWSADYC
eukprot:gene8437-10222_t